MSISDKTAVIRLRRMDKLSDCLHEPESISSAGFKNNFLLEYELFIKFNTTF